MSAVEVAKTAPLGWLVQALIGQHVRAGGAAKLRRECDALPDDVLRFVVVLRADGETADLQQPFGS